MLKSYRGMARGAGSRLGGRIPAIIIAALTLAAGSAGWIGLAIERERQDQELWEDDRSVVPTANQDVPERRDLRLNSLAMRRLLEQAPAESLRAADERSLELPLPMPDGSMIRFSVVQSPVLEPLLAAKYPEIRTFTGQSIDDPTVTMRCDLTPLGFHATVVGTAQGVVSIHPPESQEPSDRYISYFGMAAGGGPEAISCDFRDPLGNSGATSAGHNPDHAQYREAEANSPLAASYQVGESLRTFRIAVAATWEYSNSFGGGTTAGTVASITTWLNGVNAIYEREMAIRLRLVDAPTIIYSTERGFTSASDPFSNGSNGTLLGQAGPVFASYGAANFDVGHVLGTGGGGVAYLGVVCRDSTVSGGPVKGLGVSSLGGSLGNSGGIYVIAHELGHQFGAYHTFNGTSGNCGGSNRTGNSAFEPGSGMTIMSYAGGCGPDNIVLSATGTLRFHVGSLRQMFAHLEGVGRCFTSANTSNSPPTVSAGPDYTIPVGTPFELRATGSDPDAADNASLTYVWEQTDPGLSFSNPPYTDSGDPSSTTRPIFRSYAPVSSPVRVFPSLNYILNNANVPPDTVNGLRSAESLPAVGRVLNFGVALRDNRSGGGGLAEDGVRLTVAAGTGPFRVTAPNTAISWTGGTTPNVTWQVSNTNLSPINCSQVRISLSTDGGQTFPIILSAATPNDGSEAVTVPSGISTTQARIRVEAVGNIFFDISDVPFTIISGGATNLPTVTAFASNPATPTANAPFSGTLTGTNFISGATEVWFCVDGTSTCSLLPANGVSFNSSTSLGLRDILLAAGSWQVYVQTSAGASNRSASFRVQSPPVSAPVISGYTLSPTPPVAGEPFGGTITGSNFVSGQTRLFLCPSGSNGCTEQDATRATFISTTSLALNGLTLSGGSWQFYVQTPAGLSNRSAAFNVTTPASPPPVISAFAWSPSSPVAGSPFSGSINGSNFVVGGTQVFFCPASSSSCTAVPASSITVASQSSLSLSNVSLTSGSWQFYLQTPAGSSARSTTFTIQSPGAGVPTISSYTWDPAIPVSGRAFSGAITGDNFIAGSTMVFFCQIGRPFCTRQSQSIVNVLDRTRLTLSTVTLTSGTWQFYLQTGSGVSARSSTFTVQQVSLGVPTIESYTFNPTAPEPDQPFQLRLNGTGYVAGGTRLFFCPVDSASCIEIQSSAISVPLPSLLIGEQIRLGSGSWQIQVRTAAGISERSTPFLIRSGQPLPPQISGLATSPASPFAGQSFTLTVNGSGFVPGATRLFFCLAGTSNCSELPAAQLRVDGTATLTATAVSLNSGSWQVYVRTAAGDSSRSGAFAIQAQQAPPPTISGYTLTPAQPVANQPFQVGLAGAGFAGTATQVLLCPSQSTTCSQVPASAINASSAVSLTLSDLRLIAGTWQFQIQTPAGISARSVPFTVSTPSSALPVITSTVWSPAAPETGVSFYGRLGGANFVPDETELFLCPEGGTACLQAARTSVKFVDQNTLELGPLSLAGGRWQVYVRTPAGDSNRSASFEVATRQGGFPSLVSYILRPTVPRANAPFSGIINGTNFETSGTRVYFCQSGTNRCQLVPSRNVVVTSANSLSISNVILQRGSWQLYLQTSIAWTDRSRPFLVQ